MAFLRAIRNFIWPRCPFCNKRPATDTGACHRCHNSLQAIFHPAAYIKTSQNSISFPV